MIKCRKESFKILADNNCQTYYPYLKDDKGGYQATCLSPIHCRSVVVNVNDEGRYVVIKGNGLTYSTSTFLHTPEMPSDVWGMLRRDDALRDFYCGMEIHGLGIKTNLMECVMELDLPVIIPQSKVVFYPAILQYNVECPFRIADAGFLKKDIIHKEVSKWERFNTKGYSDAYLIAANVLIGNLRILHDNNILHNALTPENLTWALELLDFELCHTPNYPYTQEDYARHVPDLFDREVVDIYRQINYIAGVLFEEVNHKQVCNIFLDYGFDLKQYLL